MKQELGFFYQSVKLELITGSLEDGFIPHYFWLTTTFDFRKITLKVVVEKRKRLDHKDLISQ
jgi:hypothetical protein